MIGAGGGFARSWLAVASLCVTSTPAVAQTQALNAYFNGQFQQDAENVARKTTVTRTAAEIRGLLPHSKSASFVNYVIATRSRSLLGTVDALRLNKILESAAGVSATSLASRVVAPAVLGAAVEYGGILQQTNGSITTLRGNLLGVAKLAFGREQFPYCPEIDSDSCTETVKQIRRFSAAVSFENVKTAGGTSTSPPGAPATADLLGNDFRVVSWGGRFDLTPSNYIDDPKFIAAWNGAIETLKGDPTGPEVTRAVDTRFKTALENEVYTDWMSETVELLRNAPGESEFYSTFEKRLNLLVSRMSETDSDFSKNVSALDRAYSNYFDVRDALIREAQVHKMSVEYTNQRSLNQLTTSNLRFIYSHQPTKAPAVVTLNTAVTWYDDPPSVAGASRVRDVQAAAQLDRRVGQVPHFGYAVLTFAGYYQWMKEDALIPIPAVNVAPGSGIVLPAPAPKLLGTKGHIGVVQSKVSLPIGELIKVPISVTWATRRELIKESDVRGQVGFTVDLDGLFR